jgi:hypothetical protein
MAFQVEELSIQLIEALAPLRPRIKQRDKALEDQLRRAATQRCGRTAWPGADTKVSAIRAADWHPKNPGTRDQRGAFVAATAPRALHGGLALFPFRALECGILA